MALWLHESTQTTHIYEHADPALKEQAIARTAPVGAKPSRYRPPDELLAFLEARKLCGTPDPSNPNAARENRTQQGGLQHNHAWDI